MRLVRDKSLLSPGAYQLDPYDESPLTDPEGFIDQAKSVRVLTFNEEKIVSFHTPPDGVIESNKGVMGYVKDILGRTENAKFLEWWHKIELMDENSGVYGAVNQLKTLDKLMALIESRVKDSTAICFACNYIKVRYIVSMVHHLFQQWCVAATNTVTFGDLRFQCKYFQKSIEQYVSEKVEKSLKIAEEEGAVEELYKQVSDKFVEFQQNESESRHYLTDQEQIRKTACMAMRSVAPGRIVVNRLFHFLAKEVEILKASKMVIPK